MSATFERKETFPAGTEERRIVEEQRLRLGRGAVASGYCGSLEDGWRLITTWAVAEAALPDERGRPATVVRLTPRRARTATG